MDRLLSSFLCEAAYGFARLQLLKLPLWCRFCKPREKGSNKRAQNWNFEKNELFYKKFHARKNPLSRLNKSFYQLLTFFKALLQNTWLFLEIVDSWIHCLTLPANTKKSNTFSLTGKVVNTLTTSTISKLSNRDWHISNNIWPFKRNLSGLNPTGRNCYCVFGQIKSWPHCKIWFLGNPKRPQWFRIL